MLGTIFDIKEFALGDGDGIRTTVFLKGCPLRCIWCHNPEGLCPTPELYVKQNACTGCGLCRVPCSHEDCKPYGRCLHVCPSDLVSVCGRLIDHRELLQKLLAEADTLKQLGGGITLSGGEPLLQKDFVLLLMRELRGKIHLAIETSGYADEETFREAISLADLVIMDIKIADPTMHKLYTGVDNAVILKNASILKEIGVNHIFRTPLIPGITDTEENLRAISAIVGEDKIELLPYNRLAPAKYKSVGRTFTDKINADAARVPDISFFKNAKLR